MELDSINAGRSWSPSKRYAIRVPSPAVKVERGFMGLGLLAAGVSAGKRLVAMPKTRNYKDRAVFVRIMDMAGFTLHDLQCFDAVVRAGGFQAAANQLHGLE